PIARRSGSAPLEQEDVPPHPPELADPLSPPDEPEPAAPVERERRGVLGEDPGLEGPDPRRVGSGDRALEEGAADAPALRRRVDVDRDVGHAAVRAAVGAGRERDPADDAAVLDRDEPALPEVRAVPGLPG